MDFSCIWALLLYIYLIDCHQIVIRSVLGDYCCRGECWESIMNYVSQRRQGGAWHSFSSSSAILKPASTAQNASPFRCRYVRVIRHWSKKKKRYYIEEPGYQQLDYMARVHYDIYLYDAIRCNTIRTSTWCVWMCWELEPEEIDKMRFEHMSLANSGIWDFWKKCGGHEDGSWYGFRPFKWME
jgi:hypothetical protein